MRTFHFFGTGGCFPEATNRVVDLVPCTKLHINLHGYARMEIVGVIFSRFSNTESLSFMFSVVFEGPGGFGKGREAHRKDCLQFASKSEQMVPTYDRKLKKLTTFNVSVLDSQFMNNRKLVEKTCQLCTNGFPEASPCFFCFLFVFLTSLRQPPVLPPPSPPSLPIASSSPSPDLPRPPPPLFPLFTQENQHLQTHSNF